MKVSRWVFTLLCGIMTVYCDVIDFTPERMKYYRNRVEKMFYHAYNGYLNYAYPYDELKPISCTGMDTWGSFSLTLVDALDTLVIMGNHTEFQRATEMVLKHIDFMANVNVSVFETNIRVVGGLISAHMLSGMANVPLEDGWPCSGPLLRVAERMANKLLPAFNTYTGMPFGTVNLRYGVHKYETPITCTAAVGSYILEFGSLSRLTGNPHYERVAMKALEELWKHKSALGLVGNHINVQTGQWTATDAGIGAGVDSYFEYLAKASVLLNRPELMRQFKAYKRAIQSHVQHEDWFLWVSMTKGHVTMPVFQSLEQFWPGVLSLVGEIEPAMRILQNYRSVLKQYGFSPEFYNVPTMEAVNRRSGYPLRPELAESIVHLYQATRDPLLLQIGAEIIEAIEFSTKTDCGYATIQNVVDHTIEDRMESFFLSETTKYLYLLFDQDNFIHNPGEHGRVVDTPTGKCVIETGGYIFNTEAHPLDPSILYCCDKRRQKDLAVLESFQDSFDFVDILGLGDDESELFDMQDEDIDEPVVVPIVVYNVTSSEAQITDAELRTPPESEHENDENESNESSDFDGDESAEEEQQSEPEQNPTQRKLLSIESIEPRKVKVIESRQCAGTVGTNGDAFRMLIKPTGPPRDNPIEPMSENRLFGILPVAEAKSDKTKSKTIKLKKFTSVRPSTQTEEKKLNEQEAEQAKIASALVGHLVGEGYLQNDESKIQFADLMKTIKQVAQKSTKIDIVRSHENWRCDPKTDDFCEPGKCRIFDRQFTDPRLNRVLRLMYHRTFPVRDIPLPLCSPNEVPKESDKYLRQWPNFVKLRGYEHDEIAVRVGSVNEIEVTDRFKAIKSLRTAQKMGHYVDDIMSCPFRPITSRIFSMGEISYS